MRPDRSNLARWARAGAVALLFTALTLWLLAPLARSAATVTFDPVEFHESFGRPDVLLNAWILAWGTHALSIGRFRHFFDANAFHPEPSSLAYSEHLLGAQPLFAPLYLATDDLTLAYNAWVLLSFPLCGLAAYWVALRWLRSHLAAAVAGVAYAFAPWRFYELTHTQLLSVQYLPLLAYAVWRSGERRDAAGWLAICTLAAIQALTGYYVGYVGFLVASVFAGVCLFSRPGQRARRSLFLGSALAAAVLLMVPVSLPYLELARSDVYGGRPVIGAAWERVVAWAFPPFASPDAAGWGAWWLLPWVAASGALVGLVSPRLRALSVALALLACAGAALAWGPAGSLLGVRIGRVHDMALAIVPGWSGLRVWERWGIAGWLALCLFAAVPFARCVRWPRLLRPARVPLALALLVGLVASAHRVQIGTRPSPLKAMDQSLAEWLAQHGEGDPVLRLHRMPFDRMPDVDAMAVSTRHWLPLVNGYSGYFPPSYEALMVLSTHLPHPRALETLRQLNVARWLLVEAGDRSYGMWEGAAASAGARLRVRGARGRIFELPYRRDRKSRALARDPDRTWLGTPRSRLPEDALEAEIVPLRRSIQVKGLFVWLHLRVTNLSHVRWPGVAADKDGLVGLTLRIREGGAAPERPLDPFFRLTDDLAPGVRLLARLLLPAPGAGRFELVPCLEQFARDRSRCFPEAAVTLVVPGGKAR